MKLGIVAGICLVVAAAIIAGSSATLNATVTVDDSRPGYDTVSLRRYHLRGNLDHFYTTNFAEPPGDGWVYEGVVGLVFPSPTTGTVPLHRYYNSNVRDHLYTTNWDDLGGGKNDYVYEGVQCYVFPEMTDDTLPVYRYYSSNNKDHFYTQRFNELKDGRGGYVLEGIVAYVLKVE